MADPIARLVKNGVERAVHSRAELVELRFDGWREIKAAVETVRDGAERLAGAFTHDGPAAGADVVPATSLDLAESTGADASDES